MEQNLWIDLLNTLPLSKTEQEIVKRFAKEPEGKGFLPVSDILRAHGLTEESLEILVQGLNRFPTYSVARVVLIRELYECGMIAQAWKALIQSPTTLKQNTLAQKLSYRLHVILGKEIEAREIFDHMKRSTMVDQETRKLSDKLDISGIEFVRQELINELEAKGVEIAFPTDEILKVDVEKPEERPVKSPGIESIPRQAATQSDVDNFYVVSLKDIFNASDFDDNPNAVVHKGTDLNTKTLAEIYEKQEHFSKALNVYKQLLKNHPSHDFYKNKVAEMSRRVREMQAKEVEIENEIIDQLESVEIIDRQMDFYSSLLNKLPNEKI